MRISNVHSLLLDLRSLSAHQLLCVQLVFDRPKTKLCYGETQKIKREFWSRRRPWLRNLFGTVNVLAPDKS